MIDLTRMKDGETGIIKELNGGQDFIARLQGMGLRPGKRIKKVSSHFWRGPQTVEIDNSRFALGFGMARKISVEIEK